MIIVVPEPKRVLNLAKHGLDLADFEDGFSWDRHLVVPAKPSRTGRERRALVGRLHGVLTVTAIVSPLGSEALAIVSLRPASRKERERYEAEA